MVNSKLSVLDIVVIPLLTAILYTQELLLTFIPNVQLTICLILIYSKVLGLKKTSIIVCIHTILDNINFGLSIFFPVMLGGLLLIPLLTTTVFKKVNNVILLSLLGILYSLLYSWIYIIPSCITYDVSFISYFLSDIPFEIPLCISSFVSILILYLPISKVLNSLYHKYQKKESTN